jgi:hypothetical protein
MAYLDSVQFSDKLSYIELLHLNLYLKVKNRFVLQNKERNRQKELDWNGGIACVGPDGAGTYWPTKQLICLNGLETDLV